MTSQASTVSEVWPPDQISYVYSANLYKFQYVHSLHHKRRQLRALMEIVIKMGQVRWNWGLLVNFIWVNCLFGIWWYTNGLNYCVQQIMTIEIRRYNLLSINKYVNTGFHFDSPYNVSGRQSFVANAHTSSDKQFVL